MRLVAISPEFPEHSHKLIARRKLGFDILHDAGNAVAGAYGLRYTVPEPVREIYLSFNIDLPTANGDDSWTLPMPARYVIDAAGMIRWAAVHPDYTTRPEPAETLAALRALA